MLSLQSICNQKRIHHKENFDTYMTQNATVQICSGITCGRVLNGQLYARRFCQIN